MPFHQVKVDEQVFAYVKANAEPLVDDFNSAIKRLLNIPGATTARTKPSNDDCTSRIPGLILPRAIPQALRQIIEVAYLVTKQHESRTDATQIVARLHGVAVQTVQDKYCRQLEFTAVQFDRVLDEPDLIVLRGILKGKFVEHVEDIERALRTDVTE